MMNTINFTQSGKTFVLSPHHNGNNKRLWNKYYTLCLGNIPKDFTINNMKKMFFCRL